MAKKPLAQQAASFTMPDISQFVPPEMNDTVEKIVAAGVKMMYAPQMKAELVKAVQSQDPVPKKLAENVTGLLLLLDQKSKGGIPVQAIFPAAMKLMGEGAEVLSAAGQEVTQEDFNEASLMLFTTLGKKLGATDEQLMGAAQQAIPGEAAAGPEGGPAEPAGEPMEPDDPMTEEPMPEEEQEPMP